MKHVDPNDAKPKVNNRSKKFLKKQKAKQMREQRKDGREVTFANNKNVQVARRKLFEKFQVHVDLHVVKENLKTLKKALAQNYVCSEALVMACQERHSK